MQLLKFPKKTHGTREAVNWLAEGSVNTDAPHLGMEILKVLDRQLAVLNIEIIVFDNGNDALIWKLKRRDPYQPVKMPETISGGFRRTSDRVSTLAAAIMGMDNDKFRQTVIDSEEFIDSVRSVAASALVQDEIKRNG